MSEEIHESIRPIYWLAGRWVSEDGRGTYPTIVSFDYHDTIEFVAAGQPMLNYTSASTHPVDKSPMHQERGFLRVKHGSNELAFVVSHNFGLTTVKEGLFDPETMEISLHTSLVSRMSFAKPPKVVAFERNFKLVSPACLEMVLRMQTEYTPMTEHLRATYNRV